VVELEAKKMRRMGRRRGVEKTKAGAFQGQEEEGGEGAEEEEEEEVMRMTPAGWAVAVEEVKWFSALSPTPRPFSSFSTTTALALAVRGRQEAVVIVAVVVETATTTQPEAVVSSLHNQPTSSWRASAPPS
jgi:hypothetical protein